MGKRTKEQKNAALKQIYGAYRNNFQHLLAWLCMACRCELQTDEKLKENATCVSVRSQDSFTASGTVLEYSEIPKRHKLIFKRDGANHKSLTKKTIHVISLSPVAPPPFLHIPVCTGVCACRSVCSYACLKR